MTFGVSKLAFMLMRPARTRIGPLLAALVIILAANGAVRVWRNFDQAETRRSYMRLSEEAKRLAQDVSILENRLSELKDELESKRLMLERLDREIRVKTGHHRLEALARKESLAKYYNLRVDDYKNLYREYEGKVTDLRTRYETLNRLGDELDLPFQEIPVKIGESSP